MTTYVLGAGASRHAGYPLARELGDVLRDWICHNKPTNHEYRIHIDMLYELYGGLEDIESIITDLDNGNPSSPVGNIDSLIRGNILSDLRNSIRKCFDGISRGQATLYNCFAHEQVQKGDVLITFNYDFALERELKKAQLWEICDGYGFPLDIPTVPQSRVTVLKLHGSMNWWGVFFGGSKSFGHSSNGLGTRPVIFCQHDWESLGYPSGMHDPGYTGPSTAAAIPAIIMPTSRKRFYFETSFGREWENFWENLWKQAEHALQSSEKIVIIGYRKASVDDKARELLLEKSDRDAHITIYCGSTNTTIRNEFYSQGFQQVETFGESRFEDYLGH